eukprot:Gb_26381 [translate_table: standard]
MHMTMKIKTLTVRILMKNSRLRSQATGSARGILYLHNEANPPIFHRDIKASNILLDEKYNTRVANFGLSKLAQLPDLEGSAPGHVSTVVKGTLSYLEPTYFLTHKLTDKSDVYSFGVVLHEILTGMQPISHGKNIVREENKAYESGVMLSMINPRMGSYPLKCLEPLVRLAASCYKDETDARPFMADVVRDLENILQLTLGLDTTLQSMYQMRMMVIKEKRDTTRRRFITHKEVVDALSWKIKRTGLNLFRTA